MCGRFDYFCQNKTCLMDSFGDLIRIARESKGLFLRQVAASVDIDQAIISKFERGERRPTREQVERFISFYKLNKKQLFTSWLSDKIAHSILDEDNAEEALIAALQKVKSIKKIIMKNKLKVAELFAGVGGFRLGLEGWQGKSASSFYKKNLDSNFEVVWSNQWEPSTKIQHASAIYEKMFGRDNHSNHDINQVNTSDIPDHDILCGGFPCQDYSVAKQLSKSQGIEGKKGVLWWQIHRILEEKGDKKPDYVFLENVDRLIKSPVAQRGRDFAIILASLSDLGYAVEWRVINAADYGMPQRRRRVFIFAYNKKSLVYKKIIDPIKWIRETGLFSRTFEIANDNGIVFPFEIQGNLVDVTKNFNKKTGGKGAFGNTGIMIDRQVWTFESKPNYDGTRLTLGDIIEDSKDIPKEYYLDDELEKWNYLKGAKKEPRKKSNGEVFYYTEGPMSFPDPLDKPARTIITSEGGKTASRFKHVINQKGKLRRLIPIELERANMFPDNHTEGANDTKRAFFMGNALVVGVIEKVGLSLMELLEEASSKKKVNQKHQLL